MDAMLSYDDICIIPNGITNIKSRSECNPYDEYKNLPIFASCMSSVVSVDNVKDFNESKISVVVPRNYSLNKRIELLKEYQGTNNFVAFSLAEAKKLWGSQGVLLTYTFKNTAFKSPFKICIDLANGHMKDLLDTVSIIKMKYRDDIVIMTGNIANPDTYVDYDNAGVDYVRVGIGGGSVCSTSSNTGIHYPYFSLLKEIRYLKNQRNRKCKIIADGNIRGYRDVQKALIYADYVMIGGLFNKAIESAAKTTYGKFYWNVNGFKIFRPLKTLFNYGKEVPKSKYPELIQEVKKGTVVLWKQQYGMSTKIAQAEINKANSVTSPKLKTSEGIVKYQKVEYDLKGWVENETDYLRSAMSYTNSTNIEEFHNSRWVKINQIRYNN